MKLLGINIITKRLHIWRLDMPLYYCGELMVPKGWHLRWSFILFGHKICYYNK